MMMVLDWKDGLQLKQKGLKMKGRENNGLGN